MLCTLVARTVQVNNWMALCCRIPSKEVRSFDLALISTIVARRRSIAWRRIGHAPWWRRAEPGRWLRGRRPCKIGRRNSKCWRWDRERSCRRKAGRRTCTKSGHWRLSAHQRLVCRQLNAQLLLGQHQLLDPRPLVLHGHVAVCPLRCSPLLPFGKIRLRNPRHTIDFDLERIPPRQRVFNPARNKTDAGQR